MFHIMIAIGPVSCEILYNRPPDSLNQTIRAAVDSGLS